MDIRRDEVLRRIPVIMLTASQAEEDILTMYDLQANCYISKPLNFDKFIKTVRAIEHFWLTVVKLPEE